MKSIGLLLCLFTSFSVLASNYPSNYCAEKIRVQHQDSLVIAFVESGCMGAKFVFGLKEVSYNDSVEAVVTTTCQDTATHFTVSKNLKLYKQWYGPGFLSAALRLEEFAFQNCMNKLKQQVTISIVGGEKYIVNFQQLYSIESRFTNAFARDQVSDRAWELISLELEK